MYFRNFVITSPWKRAGPFIWINLNPLQLRMLCVKFGWNWPTSSGEEEENVKSLWQQRNDDDNDKDDDGQRTNFDQKRSLEPSVQVSLKVCVGGGGATQVFGLYGAKINYWVKMRKTIDNPHNTNRLHSLWNCWFSELLPANLCNELQTRKWLIGRPRKLVGTENKEMVLRMKKLKIQVP